MSIGQLTLDWINPMDFGRMRHDKLERARNAMAKYGLDALLCFTPENIRYITGTVGIPVPLWRYCLLAGDSKPILYELGGDYLWVKQNSLWMEDRIKIGVTVALVEEEEMRRWALNLKKTLRTLGISDGKIGIDHLSFKVVAALEAAGLTVTDGNPAMVSARMIKTQDEIEALKSSVRLSEGAFPAAKEVIKPGARECDVRAAIAHYLFAHCCEMIRGVVTANSYPYWRTFNTDRPILPGDLVIIDEVHIYGGMACDHVRTFLCGDEPTREQKDLYKRCYERLYGAIEMFKPGNTTAQVAEKLAEPEDYSESTIHLGHGIGLGTHEPPFITFLSKNHPIEIKPNMAFAVETYEHNERQGVRLEENLVVTEKGYEVISLYPHEEKFLR